MKRICFKCSRQLGGDEKVCPECGGRLGNLVSPDASPEDYRLTPIKKLGFVSEEQIQQFLAKGSEFPMIDLRDYEIDRGVIEHVSASTAKKRKVVPVNVAGRSLVVAMSDPGDVESINAVARESGMNVEVVAASPDAIEAALLKYYR